MLKRNIIANFFGQSWAALMGLAFVPVYIKYLGVEAYGLIGLFAVLQAWLGLLDMGISPTLGREMARFTAGSHSAQSIRDLLRSLEIIFFTVAVGIALIVWAGSDWLAAHWLRADQISVDEVAHALSITALVIGLRFCEGVYRSAIIGLQRQVWLNGAHAIISTLRHAGVIGVLAFVAPTIEAFFLWQASVSLIVVVIYAWKLRCLLPASPAPARFSRIALTSVLAFSGGVFGIHFLSVLLTQLDKVLLSRLLTLEDFGYYMLAAVLAGGLLLMIAPITQAFYPRMVELATLGDDIAFAGLYHQGAQLVTLVTVPIMLVAFLFPEGVLYLWSGNAILAANTSPIVAPLALGSFLNALMWMPYQAQLTYGWTRLGLMANLVAVCLLVPAILWLVPIYGAVGAAWLWVALNLGYVSVQVHFMHKRILRREKAHWYGRDLVQPISGAVASVMLLQWIVSPGEWMSRMEWGLFLVGVTLVAYLLALFMCDRVWPSFKHMAVRILKVGSYR